MFNVEWEEEFFFAENLRGKAECMICGREVSMKRYTIERHYRKCHKDYVDIKDEKRTETFLSCKKSFFEKMANEYATATTTTANCKCGQEPTNPYDVYFKGVSETMQRLPSDLAARGQMQIMQIICNLELEALRRKQIEESFLINSINTYFSDNTIVITDNDINRQLNVVTDSSTLFNNNTSCTPSEEQRNETNSGSPNEVTTDITNYENSNDCLINDNDTSVANQINQDPSNENCNDSGSDIILIRSPTNHKNQESPDESDNEFLPEIKTDITTSDYMISDPDIVLTKSTENHELNILLAQLNDEYSNNSSAPTICYTTSASEAFPENNQNISEDTNNKAPVIGVMDMDGLQILKLRDSNKISLDIPPEEKSSGISENKNDNSSSNVGAKAIRCVPFENLLEDPVGEPNSKISRIS